MGIVRWFKTWGSLLVAVIALGLSGYAIYVDNVHHQEATKPPIQREEVYDRLARLDNEIERGVQSINAVQDSGQDVSELQGYLGEAKKLRDQAESAWNVGDYTEADELIGEAHAVLDEVLQPPSEPINWWLLGVVIAGGMIMGTVAWLVASRRRGRLA